nr:4'-phosphopantetheinyl transferase superfamily protein [Virgibacillus halodenitrificans]
MALSTVMGELCGFQNFWLADVRLGSAGGVSAMSRPMTWHQLCRALDVRDGPFQDCRVALTLGVPTDERRGLSRRWRSLPPEERYRASRLLMRRLLTTLTEGDVRPHAWELARSGSGRPRVLGPLQGFHASLAYAGTACVVSVARQRMVGVDLEMWSPPLLDDLPRHLFSSREIALLDADPEIFLTLWALKESLAKERGEGLANDPERFETASYAAAPAGVSYRRVDGGTAFHGRFHLGGKCYVLAHTLGPSLA